MSLLLLLSSYCTFSGSNCYSILAGVDQCSGFLVDSNGKDSPQLDFIIAETTEIPRLILNREVSLVPVEAARAIVEIKTKLERGSLERQLKAIDQSSSKMKSFYLGSLGSNQVIPRYAIGFDADDNALFKLMNDTELLSGCCVIGKYAYVTHEMLESNIKEGERFVRLEDDPENGDFSATTTFIASVFRHLDSVTLTHTANHQVIELLQNMTKIIRANPQSEINISQLELLQELIRRLHGKRWFWEAYVSELLKEKGKLLQEQQRRNM